MIRQNLISIFTLFPSWKNYIHHSIASTPKETPGPGDQNKVDSELAEQGTLKSSGRMHCVAGKATRAWHRLPSGLYLLGCSLLAWLLVSHAGYPFKISSSCHWSLTRKRKSCELKWSWSASRLGKKSSAILLFWNSSLIALSLCVSSFVWGKGKKPPDFETVCLQHLSVNFNKRKVNGGSISNLSPKRTVFHHLKS